MSRQLATSLERPLDVDPLAAAAGLRDTPGTLLLHGQRPWAGPGRSALLLAPRWVLRVDSGGRAHWEGAVPSASPPAVEPLALPATLAAALPGTGEGPAPPVLAGWLGYELGPARWGARHPAPAPFELPDLCLGLYDAALLFGPGAPPRLAVSDAGPLAPPVSPAARWEELADRLLRAARQPARTVLAASGPGRLPDPTWHRGAVERIREHLRAGDCYQVNLTSFASRTTGVHPWEAFAHQAAHNPVPFAAYLVAGEAVLSSHSPELLLALDGDHALTAPIKGTVAQGPGDYGRLSASAKDRAEHVMIVDLCRNDLGRSCRYGSVAVDALMEELRLQGLVHLVSRVSGRARPGEQGALLPDLFPGGSVTGAPKRRAMEITTAVEQGPRGPYCGAFGWHAARSACWNIAIRTAVWQHGTVHFGCGGGIVLDSDPDHEYAELALKARSFLASLDALEPALRPAPHPGGSTP